MSDQASPTDKSKAHHQVLMTSQAPTGGYLFRHTSTSLAEVHCEAYPKVKQVSTDTTCSEHKLEVVQMVSVAYF
jgi:hypothetical protein